MTVTENRPGRVRRIALGIQDTLLRSLFPFVALLLLSGSLWWGPWGTLVGTVLWWRIVGRFA